MCPLVSSLCSKTQLRLGTSRIKLLRNKKGIQIASDRREVAEFLRNKQESNARLWVRHPLFIAAMGVFQSQCVHRVRQ